MFVFSPVFFADTSLLLLLQSHMEKVRQSMTGKDSLLDHSIKSVLPGVHSWLSAVQNNVAEGFRLSQEEVMKLLTELNEAGTTIVMVTHSPADAEYSHRTIHLFDGHVVTENFTSKTYAV